MTLNKHQYHNRAAVWGAVAPAFRYAMLSKIVFAQYSF